MNGAQTYPFCEAQTDGWVGEWATCHRNGRGSVSRSVKRSHNDGRSGRRQLAVYCRQESKMEISVKTMKKTNEKKPYELNARDAFITILRSLMGIEDWESESPDEENRSTRDVDFLLFPSSNKNDKDCG